MQGGNRPQQEEIDCHISQILAVLPAKTMRNYFKQLSKSVIFLIVLALVIAGIMLRDKNRVKTDPDGKPLPNAPAEAAMLKMRSQGLLPEYTAICYPNARHICSSGSCVAEDVDARFILVNDNGSSTVSHCGEGGCETEQLARMPSGLALRFIDADNGRYLFEIGSPYRATEETPPFIEYEAGYSGDGTLQQGYCYGKF